MIGKRVSKSTCTRRSLYTSPSLLFLFPSAVAVGTRVRICMYSQAHGAYGVSKRTTERRRSTGPGESNSPSHQPIIGLKSGRDPHEALRTSHRERESTRPGNARGSAVAVPEFHMAILLIHALGAFGSATPSIWLLLYLTYHSKSPSKSYQRSSCLYIGFLSVLG